MAVDIGGTKIAAVLISESGKLMAREYVLTLAREGLEPVIGRLEEALGRMLAGGRKPAAISVACAGAVDSRAGVVTSSPNLPGWRDVPLGDILKERYGLPVFVVNDASAAALAEHRLGVGKGTADLVYLTVGTGIGGGIIIGGKLYLGANGCAGEVGHMTIDVSGPRCACGNYGCLELMASGTAVAREAVRRLSSGEPSSLARAALESITAEKVVLAARGGDALARDVIGRAAAALGVGLVNLVNIFNPEIIVVGGGMSKMGDLLLGPAREMVTARAFSLCAEGVRIVAAKLGDEVGLVGAALFARAEMGA